MDRNKVTFLVELIIAVLAGTALFFSLTSPRYIGLPFTIDQQKTYINSLLDKGLINIAINEYLKLVESYSLNPREKANLYFIIGNLYREKNNDYESALAQYLKIKMLVPGDKLETEVLPYIVECLEKTGRMYDAQKEMDYSVSLQPKEKKPTSRVLAKLGARDIKETEFENFIRLLPVSEQQKVHESVRRKELFHQYLATELFYDAARRKGYDRDPGFVTQIQQLQKSYLAQRVIQEELKNKTVPTDKEVKLYYDANKEKYRDVNKNYRSFDQVKPEIINTLQQEKQMVEQTALVQKYLQAAKIEIYDPQLK